MNPYRHILVAVEADEEARRLLARARDLARRDDSQITVLHVVEPLPMNLNGDLGVMPLDLTQDMLEQARRWLLPVCAAESLGEGQLRFEVGGITATILEVARQLGVDLIVLGHHRQRGLAALFSHTDQGVVSKARCDVLAVALNPPA